MELLFTAIAPRGVNVKCTTERWTEHILEHGAMRGCEKAVVNTIVAPNAIYGSAEFPTRDIYFRLHSGAPFGKHLYIKVVVEVNGNRGDIVTAFPIPHIGGNIDELKYISKV